MYRIWIDKKIKVGAPNEKPLNLLYRWPPKAASLPGTVEWMALSMVTPDGAPPRPWPSRSQIHNSLRVTFDSLNKQLSSAYCLPGTGIDPGYTKMSKAQSPSLKSSDSLVKNSFLNFRELSNCLDCSLKMPISGFHLRDANSKSKRWSLEICLFNEH